MAAIPKDVVKSTSAGPGSATAAAGAALETAGAVADTAARAAHAGAVPRGVALARGRRARVVALAGLVGFGAIFGAVRTHRSEAIDLALMLRLQRRRRPWLDRVMAIGSWPGFPPQSRVIPPAVIGTLVVLRFRTEAAFETAAWGTALVSTALKALMKRPRPVAGTDLRVVAAPLGGSSFPSGHVITFVGVYGFLAWLAWTLVRDPALRVATTGGLLGVVAIVGPSRVYQGHHWPTDVTASYLLGTTYVIVVIEAYRRVKATEQPAALG
ncbi:MAG TPA: phosphatase PAP2 family protein [Candidatus Limnocylindrales bacterium]|nr:phosphatase PAP2 family protein [Candidatus Limnocylindrales bacterium]